jgi:hypothetical protein
LPGHGIRIGVVGMAVLGDVVGRMTMRPEATCALVTGDSPAVNAGTEPARALDLQRIEGGKI